MQHIESKEPISQSFTWNQALWLPTWKRMATESDGLDTYVRERLIHLFLKMDSLKSILSPLFSPSFNIHCAYRPQAYNHVVGGAHDSAHIAQKLLEAAVDWSIDGFKCCDVIKKILEKDLLNHLGFRMENNGENPSWIHLDTRQPVHSRYFIP